MTIENVNAIIRTDLNDVRSILLKWCGDDMDMLFYKPQSGGWSSLEVLEHITLTSHYLLIIIEKAKIKAIQRASSNQIPQDWEGYELLPASLKEIGMHRSFTWIRPEHMEPSGELPLNEIKIRLLNQFERCNECLVVLRNGEGRLCKTTMSVNGIGKLDVYQYIYFLILHAKRHLAQLENNKVEFQTRV